jgi:hypothetical protein
MSDALGLIAFVVFVAAIIGAAAGLTWVVVKLSPPKRQAPAPKS